MREIEGTLAEGVDKPKQWRAEAGNRLTKVQTFRWEAALSMAKGGEYAFTIQINPAEEGEKPMQGYLGAGHPSLKVHGFGGKQFK